MVKRSQKGWTMISHIINVFGCVFLGYYAALAFRQGQWIVFGLDSFWTFLFSYYVFSFLLLEEEGK
jgi:hypothetical protein